jgi:acyl-CoA thioester hydrolase
VGARTTTLGEDRFTMQQIVVSQRHQRVAAEGESVIVSYDYNAGHKTALPDDLRRDIEELEATRRTHVDRLERS